MVSKQKPLYSVYIGSISWILENFFKIGRHKKNDFFKGGGEGVKALAECPAKNASFFRRAP